jgi:protein SCO1/2
VSTAPVGGHFTLTSHFGERMTPESFGDRHVLFFFGFTHCKVVCPETLSRLSRAVVLADIPATKLQPVYVSVDPRRDTPERMRQFLETRFPAFLGLTGSEQEIEHVKALFKVFAERRENPDDTADYDVPHSAYAFLMTPAGDCAAYFTSVDTDHEIAQTLHQVIQAV